MIAGSGIQASFPSGKKKAASSGEHLLDRRLAQEADQQRVDRPVEDRMMFAHSPLLLLPPDLGDDRQDHHREPDGARHRIEALPAQEHEPQEHEASARHEQQREECPPIRFAPPAGPRRSVSFSSTRKLKITTAAAIVKETPDRQRNEKGRCDASPAERDRRAGARGRTTALDAGVRRRSPGHPRRPAGRGGRKRRHEPEHRPGPRRARSRGRATARATRPRK